MIRLLALVAGLSLMVCLGGCKCKPRGPAPSAHLAHGAAPQALLIRQPIEGDLATMQINGRYAAIENVIHTAGPLRLAAQKQRVERRAIRDATSNFNGHFVPQGLAAGATTTVRIMYSEPVIGFDSQGYVYVFGTTPAVATKRLVAANEGCAFIVHVFMRNGEEVEQVINLTNEPELEVWFPAGIYFADPRPAPTVTVPGGQYIEVSGRASRPVLSLGPVAHTQEVTNFINTVTSGQPPPQAAE